MNVKHVDTSNFPQAIEDIKAMANAMQDIVTDMDNCKAKLIYNWVGEGRNEFEKMYQVVRRKLKDGTDVTWDMHEKLIEAQGTFIQYDVDAAKQMEGITKI